MCQFVCVCAPLCISGWVRDGAVRAMLYLHLSSICPRPQIEIPFSGGKLSPTSPSGTQWIKIQISLTPHHCSLTPLWLSHSFSLRPISIWLAALLSALSSLPPIISSSLFLSSLILSSSHFTPFLLVLFPQFLWVCSCSSPISHFLFQASILPPVFTFNCMFFVFSPLFSFLGYSNMNVELEIPPKRTTLLISAWENDTDGSYL